VNVKKLARKGIEKVIYIKIYMNRTMAYLSLINSVMILFLFLSNLKQRGIITWDLDRYYFLILLLGFLMLYFIGWLDLNILKAVHLENTINFERYPQFIDMKKKIDALYDKEIRKHNSYDNQNNSKSGCSS
jgi:hypothetical protein